MNANVVEPHRRTAIYEYIRGASDGWPDARMRAAGTAVGVLLDLCFVSKTCGARHLGSAAAAQAAAAAVWAVRTARSDARSLFHAWGTYNIIGRITEKLLQRDLKINPK